MAYNNHISWYSLLPVEMQTLSDSLYDRAQKERDAGSKLCPSQDDIFKALRLTPPDKTKIIIIGQDPYHTPGQANGLAFSISPGHKLQPSLMNIFQELHDDLGISVSTNGDLTKWAEQGVLLLNSTLTVYEHQPNSNSDWGWQMLTHAILETAAKLPSPIVFMAWGQNAINNVDSITMTKDKLILRSTHPSPYSFNKPGRSVPAFQGSRPFSKANAFLQQHGVEPVDWTL